MATSSKMAATVVMLAVLLLMATPGELMAASATGWQSSSIHGANKLGARRLRQGCSMLGEDCLQRSDCCLWVLGVPCINEICGG